HPAAADVRPAPAAVVQDVRVLAARVLEGVGQDRHGAELPRLVHLPGEFDGRGRAPGRVEYDGPERVAEDVADEMKREAVESLGRCRVSRLPPGASAKTSRIP